MSFRRSRHFASDHGRPQEARHRRAVRRPGAGDRRRPRGPRRSRPVAYRLGQDPGLRPADRRPARADARQARRPGAGANPRARDADRRRAAGRRGRSGALRSPRSTAGSGSRSRPSSPAGAHIVVATPGRLEDLLQRRALTLEHVGILVIDEADRMLDMGFKPAVDRIVAQTPRDRQTLFFSATLEAAAGKQARAYTRDARRHVHAAEGREPGHALPPLPPPPPPGQGGRAGRRASRLRARANAGLRPHQARRRSAGQAARPAAARRRRHARQQVPAAATEGARPLRQAATSTPWSPPTSPRAGSTSTTSPT